MGLLLLKIIIFETSFAAIRPHSQNSQAKQTKRCKTSIIISKCSNWHSSNHQPIYLLKTSKSVFVLMKYFYIKKYCFPFLLDLLSSANDNLDVTKMVIHLHKVFPPSRKYILGKFQHLVFQRHYQHEAHFIKSVFYICKGRWCIVCYLCLKNYRVS